MRYFYDTEFIEDGKTIDLISIGIVAEDGREYYAQNHDCRYDDASDWVWRNVYPHLHHFELRGHRSCKPWAAYEGQRGTGGCRDLGCLWRYHDIIGEEIKAFCDPEKYGKPEFWAYYAAYDHVALCQLFGRMMDLPDGFPMWTRDIKQWCVYLGDPALPGQSAVEHIALNDARWTKAAWEFLNGITESRNGGWA